MILADKDVLNNTNDNKNETSQEQVDININVKNKLEDKAFYCIQNNKETNKIITKETKPSTKNTTNIISRNNLNIINHETTGLSFASGLKKSTYTIISERAIDHLFNTGQLPDNLDIDTLIKGRTANTTNHSIGKIQPKEKGKENNRITINNFLSRNHLKSKNNFKHYLNNDSNKSSVHSSDSYQKNKHNKKDRNKIRSPKEFLNDQTKYLNKQNKKIDKLRLTIEENEIKEIQSNPNINLKSIEIAERATSANPNTKKKKIHIRLYEDMKLRVISKEKLTQDIISLNQKPNNKHKRVFSQDDINECANKLYQKKIRQVKTKNKQYTPCHMEKSDAYHSRDYSSFQSNIRMNNKKDMDLIQINANKNESKVKRSNDIDKISLNNKIILIKKLNQAIDKGLNTIDIHQENNNKDKINYSEYCQLMFNLGFIQYDHANFKQYLQNNNIHIVNDDNTLIDYNSSIIDTIQLEDIVLTNTVPLKQITKSKLAKEQEDLYKSWKEGCEDNIKEENDTIAINQIKLLFFCICGLYTGEINHNRSNIKTIKEGISNSHSTSSIKDKAVQNNNNQITYEELNKQCFKSSTNEVIKYNKDKAKFINQSFKTLAENRFKYELHIQHKRKTEKLKSANSSNPHLTFKPSINNTYKISDSRLKVEETYDLIQKRKNKDLDRLQKEKELNELKECTFNPNNRPKKHQKSSEISNRLYSYNKSTKTKKKNCINNNNSKNKEANNEKDTEKEYPFSPKINKPINEGLFDQKSIKNDPIVSNKIKQYEKARIEKKLIVLLSEKGRAGLSHMKTSEDLVNELENKAKAPLFKFDIERKHCKDTFDKFANNEAKNRNESKREQPIFTIEVKIKDRIELLHYYKNDDPAFITQRFCKRNNLGENSNERIYSVIEEKLRSNDL